MPLVASAPKDRIILGLMTFGYDESTGARITNVDDFKKCLDLFQSRGYNEVDTARVYTGTKQEAFTREAGWKERGLTLATKIKYPSELGAHTADKVVESMETSLKELGTDCVDICYIHAADRATPFAETFEAMDKLHKAGKFVRLGVSNFTAAEVAEVVMMCKYNGWVRPTIYQGIYNAITRGIDAELIPACRRYGLDVVVYNPIAGGLFSGKIKSVDIDPQEGRFSSKNPTSAAYRKRYFRESTFKALQTIEQAIEKHPGLTMIETALRWCVHHSKLQIKGGTDGILIGVSSYEQLENNLDNLEKGPLPEDVVKALDEAWMLCKAEAPNYWHLDLDYKYDTREALFGKGANTYHLWGARSPRRPSCLPLMPPHNDIRLTSIPLRLNPTSRQNRTPASPAEPSPFSASSCGTDVEDYIGSGTDTPGGRTPRTPALDYRLSFAADGRSEYDDDDDDDDNMSNSSRPPYRRPTDGRSGEALIFKKTSMDSGEEGFDDGDHQRGRSTKPAGNEASRAMLSRRSSMRSRSPDTQVRMAARKKYTYAAIFLVVSLISFCLQTELGRYVQSELGWNKAYCMLYLTHGSWALLWPAQLLILRVQQRSMTWSSFWRKHVSLLRSTAHMVAAQDINVPRHMQQRSPALFLLRTTAFITSCLTVAGLSWYVAVSMTSASDLTAIYNCSAFFAYAFSVPLLKEKLRLDKSVAVLIAIGGVLVVAYGDSKEPTVEGGGAGADADGASRFLGNMIIGAGSVLYGLYEVLYKRWACPPEDVSPTRGMIFANAFGSCIGAFTLSVMWIPLPLLHILGWETFELPTGKAALYLWISVIMNATFAGSFLVLISLTSPVLSSVAALLTIFIVAVADWLLTGEPLSFAAIVGGCMIIVAFLMLSWSTWREMTEEAAHKAATTAGYQAPVDWSSDEEDKDDDRM
ncbi:NADP-dependent oxidoreductase domain-containing protein [Xylariomycetidae sp. FL0641]|nr:NADP-dependent oxidoreductase domain-containing protein [Xylariomycetidae sp. FL0641]